MGKNNQHRKESEIRILDPKRIDYTYRGDDYMTKIKSSLDHNKINQSDCGSKKLNTNKDVQRIRQDLLKNANIRTKGRITVGQSKQGHSSVYE